MGFEGDISALEDLSRHIARLEGAPERATQHLAPELVKSIQGEFAAGKDPYGNSWRPNSPKTKNHGTPLSSTGQMMAGLHAAVSGKRVDVGIPHPSEDHQSGWSGAQGDGPARPILPTGDAPPAWEQAIKKAVDEEVTGAEE